MAARQTLTLFVRVQILLPQLANHRYCLSNIGGFCLLLKFKARADGDFARADKTYDYDGYRIFTAVITDIPFTDANENAYDTEIVAIPYITFTYSVDGKEYTYYGDEIVRSVNQVKQAVEAGKADTNVTDSAEWDKDDNNGLA